MKLLSATRPVLTARKHCTYLVSVTLTVAFWCAVPAACSAGVPHTLWIGNLLGQSSLLDLEDEEEEPLSSTPGNGSDAAGEDSIGGGGEEPPLESSSLPPVVGGGISELGDLLDEQGQAVDIEAEGVYDEIRQKRQGNFRTHKVKLLRKLLRPPLKQGGQLEVKQISDSDGKTVFKQTYPQAEITHIWYYEERILQRIAKELGEARREITRFDEFVDLSHPERHNRVLRAIELLKRALKTHDSARERLIREGEAWDELRYGLVQALARLQLSRIKQHFDNGQIQQAMAACDRLLGERNLGAGPRKLIEQLLEQAILDPGLAALEQSDFGAARDALAAYVERYPSSKHSKATLLRNQLVRAAEEVRKRAVSENNPKLLDRAAEIWPRLIGLEDQRREMLEEYPILHCAYTTLPKSFSPLTARTPVERHASALLFESLVRWRSQAEAGPHYSALLASSRPIPLARGREFHLPRSHWSDSDPAEPHYCTTEDVRWTVSLMKKLKPYGFSSAWARLVKDVASASRRNPDPFRVSVYLQNDHWQPLSLMDFPILPKNSFPTCGEDEQELIAFEQEPVGTGPFVLRGSGGIGKAVRFVANPFYRRSDRPYIREIQFHQMDTVDAGEAFRKGDVHLIYDVSKTQVEQLRGRRGTIKKLPARSVYFLAPNHRRRDLKNRDLRLAIAHAIEREEILDTIHRPGSAKLDHAALNGPYPTDSWAYNSKVPEFAQSNVSAHLTRARQELGTIPTLKLIYPDAKPETRDSCAEIQRQLQAAGIEIELEGVDPNAFMQRVIELHGFDLAYWRHDFKDATYWLWPLFDPSDAEAGGANFMGYVPDKPLRDLFSRVMTHKMFRRIRATTHEIHRYLAREAIIIPLWELNTYVAVRDNVNDVNLSAFTLFSEVDSWKVRPE